MGAIFSVKTVVDYFIDRGIPYLIVNIIRCWYSKSFVADRRGYDGS
jgi:hypothetical protein